MGLLSIGVISNVLYREGSLRMKNRLAAKILISAAAILVMVFALGYNLSAQTRGTQHKSADTGHTDLNTALINLAPRFTGHAE